MKIATSGGGGHAQENMSTTVAQGQKRYVVDTFRPLKRIDLMQMSA
jgi:hypothetical protein